MPITLALVPVAAALACAAVILTLLRRPELLPVDRPNERSLHTVPVPRVGGLGIMAGVLVAFALLRTTPMLALAVAGLAAVSFLDDRAHLPVPVRLGAHAVAAITFALVLLPDLHPMWQAIAALATMWMTNLYNFMDGSDGLAGGMALFGFAAYALGGWIGGDLVLAALSAGVAAAAAAFLLFNFPPARVFMGDAGSIPLGFLAAALGLMGWRHGLWSLWFPLLVFSPFIVDASVTLARRILCGERFWQAHKTHYYQRGVQLGWGHRDTALAEYVLMAVCGAAALWSLGQPRAMQIAILGVVILIYCALAVAIDVAWLRQRNASRNDASAR